MMVQDAQRSSASKQLSKLKRAIKDYGRAIKQVKKDKVQAEQIEDESPLKPPPKDHDSDSIATEELERLPELVPAAKKPVQVEKFVINFEAYKE